MLAWVHRFIAAESEFPESLIGLKSDGRKVEVSESFTLRTRKDDWVRELMDLTLGKLCIVLKVCMRFFPFSEFIGFAHSLYIRYIKWGCSRRYDRRKAALCLTKLSICDSSILWLCGAQLTKLCCLVPRVCFSPSQTNLCIYSILIILYKDRWYGVQFDRSTKQLKYKAVPFLAYFWSVVFCHSDFFILLLYHVLNWTLTIDRSSFKPPWRLLTTHKSFSKWCWCTNPQC